MAASGQITTITSNKGKPKLDHDGYLYVFDRRSHDGQVDFWRCTRKNKDPPCLGRVHTDVGTGKVVGILRKHNHGQNVALVEVSRVRCTIKEKAICSKGGPSTIINLALKNVEPAVVDSLPPRDCLRHLVQNVRKRVMSQPCGPKSLADLIIPDKYRFYSVSDLETVPFLLYDSGPNDEHRILIFGNSANAAWIEHVKYLYGDGTFKIALQLFQQVFALVGKREDYVLPLLYCLLPNKSQATYKKMFEAIHQLWPKLNPEYYSTDYEVGAINAFKAVFPSCRINGCFFHLTRNIKKQLDNRGLCPRYSSDPEFAIHARMIAALAFVPPPDLEAAVDAIKYDLKEEIRPILSWFSRVYIGICGRRLRKPNFPPSLWSVYERTLTGLDRTNNNVEAAHRRLRSELDMEHSSIWRYVDGILKVQKWRDLQYAQFLRGESAPHKKRQYKDCDEKLQRIVGQYQHRTFWEYLRGVALNVELD
ncbi:uncharacterized protein [Hyperolius riggenbachi]|uniref:uncharacterized protein n=1 Tax=Hyperolius riggenbachi TaxID=752182 RepID=UPI0035A3901F